MARNDDNGEPIIYFIPENILQSRRIMSFRRRNLIEGAISAVALGLIIYQVPFVPRVKAIITVCMCLAVFVVNLLGIKNMSISEVVSDFIYYKKHKALYHLRSINNAKKISRNSKTGRVATAVNESGAEKIVRIAKEKYNSYKEGDFDKKRSSGSKKKAKKPVHRKTRK